MKYNLKPFIAATLKQRGKTRFNPFIGDIETAMEPLVEKAIQEQIDRVLKRIARQALAGEDHAPDLQGELFTEKQS